MIVPRFRRWHLHPSVNGRLHCHFAGHLYLRRKSIWMIGELLFFLKRDIRVIFRRLSNDWNYTTVVHLEYIQQWSNRFDMIVAEVHTENQRGG